VIKTPSQRLSRNPSAAGYSNPLRSYSVPATDNPDGTINVPVQPVIGVDPNREPIDSYLACRIYGTSGATTSPVGVLTAFSYESNLAAPLAVFAVNGVWDVANGNVQRQRTPTIFKTIGLTTAAGDTALWDPAAGQRFRLMGYVIDIAAGTTAAGACLLQLRDNATVIVNHTICGGALAASAGRVIANVQFPVNGYLSIAADNILNLNLSSVLAAGGVTAFAYGTEE